MVFERTVTASQPTPRITSYNVCYTKLLRSRYAVCGENYALTEQQRELIAIAEALGPKFAERAARYDREASFPFENYDDLRAGGLLGLCVPEHFGGRGADFKTYSLVSATIGKYCGATALTFIV